MSICRSSSRHDRTIARMSSSDSFEKATMTRSTSSSRTISGSCVRRAEEGQVLEIDARLAGLGVDEADEIEAVLRVLEQLARDELADVAGADDDGVLEVEDAPPADRPGGAAADRDEDERRDAEERELAQLRIREAERPERQRDQPDAAVAIRCRTPTTSSMRRMVGALLVSLVEPVQLRQDDPERQAGQEHQQLLRVRRAVEDAAGVEGRDQEERQRQAGEVGEEQHAPDEPAAPLVRQLGAALLEDRARAPVDGVEETPLERRRESRVAMRFRRPSLCRHQLPPIEHVLPHETASPQGPRLLFEPYSAPLGPSRPDRETSSPDRALAFWRGTGQEPRRHARDDDVGCDVARDDRAGPDQRAGADLDPAEDHGPRADRRARVPRSSAGASSRRPSGAPRRPSSPAAACR